MRVSSFAVARPAYYDRNAASIANIYLQTVAPHASTARWTYTVASGKKLQLENTTIRVIRITAATVAGTYATEVTLTIGASTYLVTQSYQTSNVANFTDFRTDQTVMTLYAGEIITGATIDTSTGGTVQYGLWNKGTLYDA